MAAGGVAGGKTVAAERGAWLCFEDEAGQTLRPPKTRTWGRRGRTPVTVVSGKGSGRVSVAGLVCVRPGQRSRLIYRTRLHRDPGNGPVDKTGTAPRIDCTGRQRLRRCAARRNCRIRAEPSRASNNAPATAASSMATPIGKVPLAPRKCTLAAVRFCKMKINRKTSPTTAMITATQAPLILVRTIRIRGAVEVVAVCGSTVGSGSGTTDCGAVSCAVGSGARG